MSIDSSSSVQETFDTFTLEEENPHLAFFGDSDIGRVRRGNEDAFSVRADLGLFMVADGMGGAAAGEVASRMLMKEVERAVDDGVTSWPADTGASTPESGARRMLAGVHRANQRIFRLAERRPRMKGMGTTFVGLLLQKRCALVAHVGDSRVYRLRDGVLTALTDDHSLVHEMVTRGFMTPEEAAVSPRRHVITRAVGVHEAVRIDTRIIDLREGDVFLLCSDGLHGEISDDDIRAILSRVEDPEGAVAALITRANGHGGADNITAVVVRIEETR